jgi:WD40 repeat protein
MPWLDANRSRIGSTSRTFVKLWDVDSGALLRSFEEHGDAVNSVALSADGRRALSGSYDRMLKLWALSASSSADTCLASFTRDGPITAVALDESHARAVVGDSLGRILAFELRG